MSHDHTDHIVSLGLLTRGDAVTTCRYSPALLNLLAFGRERNLSGRNGSTGTTFTPTEQRIVNAARECFEANGIAKTRLEEIALHAGISRQTIYKYFSGKNDIVNAIGYLEMVKINETLRKQLQKDDCFVDRLTNAIVLSVEISLKNSYLCKVVADLSMLPGFPGVNQKTHEWHQDQWRPMLQRAANNGEIAGDADFNLFVRWIMLCQFLLMHYYKQLVLDEIPVHGFVRRFMVKPLLSGKGSAIANGSASEGSVAVLAKENETLRALVSQQALTIFELSSKA